MRNYYQMAMPNRNNSTKYELFVNEIRKISKKKECNAYEEQMKRMAALVAALSSSHSWKTYEYLHSNAPFERDAIMEEARNAFDEGWKNISEVDMEEVLSGSIPDHLFSFWAFNTIPNEDRRDMINLFSEMKKEFADGIEIIDKKDEE
ncbi:MAG: hypothetical protein QXO24_01790 [Candidatus Micrarchaeaceae archaeon]